MIVLSLFDGMSCGQIALERAGIEVDYYFAAEIDDHSIQVTQTNYPNTIQLGDVTSVKAADLPPIDLLIGGSPCQGFSFAGKQLNFNDPRSALFFEFVRLLKELKPKYFLLENVKMKKEYQDVISECLGVEPVEINSSLVSAQNRKRLYWTNIPDVTQPQDKGITWGDVRERSVEVEKYYYSEAAMQWLGRHSRAKNKLLTVHADTEKMQMIEASHAKKYSSQRFFGIVDYPSKPSKNCCLMNGSSHSSQDICFGLNKTTRSLFTVGSDGVRPFTKEWRVPDSEFFFRYITPMECERLQTVPDNYTAMVSDTQRYIMLGNGWTVDVIAHIFKGLK